MKNPAPDHLFEKYTAGNCTEEEKAIVEAWYLSQLEENQSRPSAKKIQSAKEAAWKVIMPTVSKGYSLYKWSAAAAILTTLLFVYLFRPDQQVVPSNNEVQVKEKPKANPGTVLYASKVENSMMKLPDGSTVILEKGSKLTLLPAFNKGKTREVTLEGKAFFDIVHMPSKRFIIHSGTVNTTVLGTAFDVTAMPGSHRVKVNVIRGRVQVEDIKSKWMTIIPKNFQVEFVDNEKPVRQAVNAAIELSWNQADLEFNDIAVGDAQSRLEDQFGYKIDINDLALKNTTFKYSMRRKESMESFMKSICAFIGASYTIDHKNKIISIQPLNQ